MSITSKDIIVPAFVAGRCRPTQGETVPCTLADIMGASGEADRLPCLSTIRCTDSERQGRLADWIHDASDRERERARILYEIHCAADREKSAEMDGDTERAGAESAEIARLLGELDALKSDKNFCALGFSSICECSAKDADGAPLFTDGLLLIDIDLDKNAIGGEIDALERCLEKDPHVIATWRSRRGEGLHGAYVCAADGASYELARAYILEDYRNADTSALSRSHTWIALPGCDWSAQKEIGVVEASDDEKAAYLARREAERAERAKARATAKDASDRQKQAYFDKWYEGIVSKGHLTHEGMLKEATWAGVVLRETECKDQLFAVADVIYEATKGGKSRESRAAVIRQIEWGMENSDAKIDWKQPRRSRAAMRQNMWTPPTFSPAPVPADTTETRATPADSPATDATETADPAPADADADAQDAPSLALDAVPISERARVIQEYFAERAEKARTEAARRALDDQLVGGFVRAVDPYSMRQYAPAFCLIAWGIVALSHYDVTSPANPTNPRIANLVARTNAGKDWTLGTHPKSRSLCAQLRETDGVAASVNADASVTGNGMAFAAYDWASKQENADRVRVTFWPEMGNATTRGYGTAERAGSIGNYDMAINYGRIAKPTNKTDQKRFEGLADEYPLKAAEIRAFQDTNGARIAIARHRGAGEGRREMWLFMDSPTADPACTDETAIDFDNALKTSAFMPDACDRAYTELRRAALPFRPVSTTFDGEPNTRIAVDEGCAEYREVYAYLIGNPERPINSFLAADRYALLRDKLSYLAGMSAGLHGRYEAGESDYWIAGYLCECLSDSMDRIMAAGADAPTEDQSVRAQVIERVEMAGAQGVYRNRLLRIADRKTIEELCGLFVTPAGDKDYDADAPLVLLHDKNRQPLYVLRRYKAQAIARGLK